MTRTYDAEANTHMRSILSLDIGSTWVDGWLSARTSARTAVTSISSMLTRTQLMRLQRRLGFPSLPLRLAPMMRGRQPPCPPRRPGPACGRRPHSPTPQTAAQQNCGRLRSSPGQCAWIGCMAHRYRKQQPALHATSTDTISCLGRQGWTGAIAEGAC